MANSEAVYSIPARYRKMENMHILFWLFKDISWCLVWKPLGLLMIFPTLIIAIVISFRNRQSVSETCHNVAIVFWIMANSYWMVTEFFHFDDHIVMGTITYRDLTVIPFAIGILILAYYYILRRPKLVQQVEIM